MEDYNYKLRLFNYIIILFNYLEMGGVREDGREYGEAALTPCW